VTAAERPTHRLTGLIAELQAVVAARGDLPVEADGPPDDEGTSWVYRVTEVAIETDAVTEVQLAVLRLGYS